MPALLEYNWVQLVTIAELQVYAIKVNNLRTV